jgi:hypothetical protein
LKEEAPASIIWRTHSGIGNDLAEYMTLSLLGMHLAFLDLKHMPERIPTPVLNKLQTCHPLNHF